MNDLHRMATRTGTQNQCVSVFLGRALAAFRFPAAVLGLTLLCSLGLIRVAPALERVDEYALKAAFLYNFSKFVEWPVTSFADHTSPFSLCVLGDDSFGSSLETLAKKPVQERTLVIKRIRSATALSGCHILYVSPQELTQPEALIRSIEKASVLTVCDVEACAEAGIMLNMRLVENRVQLDMNLDAVQRTPLKVSSQLIKLTRVVKRSE
jgi:hypothetical protein